MTVEHVGTRFVGRDRELADLAELLDQSAAGRGRLVLVGGEPGIGKSRLADELADRARERECSCPLGPGDGKRPERRRTGHGCRCCAPTFGPALLGSMPVGISAQGATDVAQMLPELRDLIADLPQPRDVGSPTSARFRLFDSDSHASPKRRARPPHRHRDRRSAGRRCAIHHVPSLPGQSAQRHVRPRRGDVSRRRTDAGPPLDLRHRGGCALSRHARDDAWRAGGRRCRRLPGWGRGHREA